MNILVTGAKGQLGSEIAERVSKHPEHRFILTDIEELDITRLEKLELFLKDKKVDVIINCAAYTAVDKAETDRAKARLINSDAVKNIAIAAKKNKAFVIHISTDFVFDGKKPYPYLEEDKTAPLSVYGRTKLEGEKLFLKNTAEGWIIRTGWLYSSYGNNFVKTVLKLAREKGKLNMIDDQTGTPTYAADLAKAILEMLQKIKRNTRAIYHYSNEGVASWYDFAKAICEIAGVACVLTPIGTRDYPTPAKRPHYSVLNKTKIKKEYGTQIPYWRDSLKRCLEKIK